MMYKSRWHQLLHLYIECKLAMLEKSVLSLDHIHSVLILCKKQMKKNFKIYNLIWKEYINLLHQFRIVNMYLLLYMIDTSHGIIVLSIWCLYILLLSGCYNHYYYTLLKYYTQYSYCNSNWCLKNKSLNELLRCKYPWSPDSRFYYKCSYAYKRFFL